MHCSLGLPILQACAALLHHSTNRRDHPNRYQTSSFTNAFENVEYGFIRNLAMVMTLLARSRKAYAIHKQIPIYPATTFQIGYPTESKLCYGDGSNFFAMNSEWGMADAFINCSRQKTFEAFHGIITSISAAK